jgi:hypothetical protein
MVIGASLRHVKEYADNQEHLIGWVRSADRISCPVGALACHLVWLNDLGAGQPILEEIRRDIELGTKQRKWWKRMLFGEAREQPIAYSTHNKAVTAGYKASGISGKNATTHIYRTTLGCDQLEAGGSVVDTGVLQGWYHDTAADVYLRGAFKSDPMLRAHGWDEGAQGYKCWWESAGDAVDIPACLLKYVFPGLDDLFEYASERYEATNTDRSSVEFLQVLIQLRRVFIQDAVLKRRLYPDFPPYAQHRVFQDAQWPEYAHAEESRIAQREAQFNKNKDNEALTTAVHGAVEAAMSKVISSLDITKLKKKPTNTNTTQRHTQPTLVDMTIERPCPAAELPELQEPICMYATYNAWQQQRAYFYTNPHPPWKKRFGKRASAMKLRYSRMRPFLFYLDKCGSSARRVLDALDAYRTEKAISVGVFIKQCFYHLEFPISDKCKKPPPIRAQDLKARMERDGLPAFST